ncbi:hypothetical protein Y032_0105g3668 [Ancylostoma ceylanicum]|uniref:SCP domain-containing protein n=1 Tax=Ancylostoma ceylanicum TaxID=53326 RepID=A0A016TG14_9BILA|nr:hypothetical protein Y032_0105g3668 [Ancylostoma ceylanicum]
MVLQNYKCELEKSAYAAAQNCAKEGSTTPGVDEVWHVIDSSMSDMKAAAEQAITTWFSQITTKGNYMMQKTGQQNILMRTPDIANFAKMVWDSHTDVGCAIVKCNAATKKIVKVRFQEIYLWKSDLRHGWYYVPSMPERWWDMPHCGGTLREESMSSKISQKHPSMKRI